jgi:hypothetical protein
MPIVKKFEVYKQASSNVLDIQVLVEGDEDYYDVDFEFSDPNLTFDTLIYSRPFTVVKDYLKTISGLRYYVSGIYAPSLVTLNVKIKGSLYGSTSFVI